jgi:hypothetical protein
LALTLGTLLGVYDIIALIGEGGSLMGLPL